MALIEAGIAAILAAAAKIDGNNQAKAVIQRNSDTARSIAASSNPQALWDAKQIYGENTPLGWASNWRIWTTPDCDIPKTYFGKPEDWADYVILIQRADEDGCRGWCPAWGGREEMIAHLALARQREIAAGRQKENRSAKRKGLPPVWPESAINVPLEMCVPDSFKPKPEPEQNSDEEGDIIFFMFLVFLIVPALFVIF